jgi:hypothetical protein
VKEGGTCSLLPPHGERKGWTRFQNETFTPQVRPSPLWVRTGH